MAKEHNEPIDEVLYCEIMYDNGISGEVPEHREFIHDVAIPRIENDFGYKVNIVRDDLTYVDLFKTPVTRGKRKGQLRGYPLCGKCWVQRDLKMRPIKNFWSSQQEDVIAIVGLAKDEEARIAKLSNQSEISLLDKYGLSEDDALQKCKTHNLLSPIYKFAPRNGCWFCPNAKEPEVEHLYDHHRGLWDSLVSLQDVPGQVKKTFNRYLTVREVDSNLYWTNQQLSLDDLNPL